jgi:hypothetical protein
MEKYKNNIIQIIKILSFGLILFQMFIFLDYLMKPRSIDLSNIAGFYGEEKKSLDMVYIGGSACFVYWAPLKAWEDKGIASYSFAADTIQAELYSYLVKETLKYQDPKVIVIDARAFQYRDVDQPPTEVAYRNILTGTPLSLNKLLFVEGNVKKYLKEDPLSYYFDLIKYHGASGHNSISEALSMMTNNFHHELKGFFFIPSVVKMQKYNFETNVETPVSTETTKILDDLLAYLKTTRHKILFIVSPYLETKEHKENFNFVERKVVAAGFDFLDANEYYNEMNLNFDTDFYNNSHVNIFGSEKYTAFLENYLIEKYKLPNRKSNIDYAKKWDVLLDNWHSRVNATKDVINSLIGSGK